jgi:MYXO-CTERM domain-containing protein
MTPPRLFVVVVATAVGAVHAVHSPAAHAADLDAMYPLTSVDKDGEGGSDSIDWATDVAFLSTGEILLTAQLDGLAGEESTGWIARYEALSGKLLWSHTLEAGLVEGDKTDSRDTYQALAVAYDDAFAVAGTWSWDDSAAYANKYLVQQFTPDGELDWERQYTDGLLSPHQAAVDVAIDDLMVHGAGWSDRDAETGGRWLAFRYDRITGAVDPPISPLIHDHQAIDGVPDQASAIDAHAASGEIVVAGTIGIAAVGGDRDDIDWHVRKVDSEGELIWEYTWAGAAGLDDRPTAAVLNDSGEVIVAGTQNVGTNNGAGRDDDWVVIKFSADGIDLQGEVLWEVGYESAAGASERAHAMALDSGDDLLVGGTWRDPVSNTDAWRVAVLSDTNGVELGAHNFDGEAFDSAVYGVAQHEDRVAVVGAVGRKVGTDLRLSVLELDGDGDGVVDSYDLCPEDGNKVEPEVCGCGVTEDDTDGDLVLDCDDECPEDPLKVERGECPCGEPDEDRDGDGTYDCNDQCPDNPDKDILGDCGCDILDVDLDEDGVVDCHDACPDSEPGEEVDPRGCPPQDEEDGEGGYSSDTDDSAADTGGCGCATGPLPAGTGWLALLTLVALRRRSPKDNA